MFPQDVQDTGPVTRGEYGSSLFRVPPPLPRNEFRPGHIQLKDEAGKDLMFFMTRSYQALVYSDGGD